MLEFSKGLLVVLFGLGLVSLLHRQKDLEDLADNFLYVMHLNPDRHLWRAFLRAAARLDDLNLTVVAAGGALYSMLRFIEAYGLWRARVWAEWFALLSCVAYLPLEIFELFHKATAAKWVLLALNVLILGYLVYVRMREHESRKNRRAGADSI